MRQRSAPAAVGGTGAAGGMGVGQRWSVAVAVGGFLGVRCRACMLSRVVCQVSGVHAVSGCVSGVGRACCPGLCLLQLGPSACVGRSTYRAPCWRAGAPSPESAAQEGGLETACKAATTGALARRVGPCSAALPLMSFLRGRRRGCGFAAPCPCASQVLNDVEELKGQQHAQQGRTGSVEGGSGAATAASPPSSPADMDVEVGGGGGGNSGGGSGRRRRSGGGRGSGGGGGGDGISRSEAQLAALNNLLCAENNRLRDQALKDGHKLRQLANALAGGRARVGWRCWCGCASAGGGSYGV